MATKNSDLIQGEQKSKESIRKCKFGWTNPITLGVESIICLGIFTMPAVTGSVTVPALSIAIVLTAIITTLLAISYAELGSQNRLTELERRKCQI
jgi:amino acid transporter